MKTKSIVAVLFVVSILVACAPAAKVVPTEKVFPTLTFTPSPTRTPTATATPTAIPVFTDTSCEPSENPYAVIPDEYWYEKPYVPNISITKICAFKGEISRDQFYIHKIQENLFFCLIPGGIQSSMRDKGTEGWFILISDNCDISATDYVDFSAPVNPPFHGNTLHFLLGWYFRNEDNTEDINGPYKRRITYVLNSEDAATAYDSLACSMWGIDTDCARATQTSTNIIERSGGTFSITKLELGNLVPNSYAWIEYMEFEFAFYIADE